MLRQELFSTAPFTAAFPVVEMDLGILQLNWTFAVISARVFTLLKNFQFLAKFFNDYNTQFLTTFYLVYNQPF